MLGEQSVALFSAGLAECRRDLAVPGGRRSPRYERIFDQCVALIGTIQRIPQPVIAVVRGVATAAKG